MWKKKRKERINHHGHGVSVGGLLFLSFLSFFFSFGETVAPFLDCPGVVLVSCPNKQLSEVQCVCWARVVRCCQLLAVHPKELSCSSFPHAGGPNAAAGQLHVRGGRAPGLLLSSASVPVILGPA